MLGRIYLTGRHPLMRCGIFRLQRVVYRHYVYAMVSLSNTQAVDSFFLLFQIQKRCFNYKRFYFLASFYDIKDIKMFPSHKLGSNTI